MKPKRRTEAYFDSLKRRRRARAHVYSESAVESHVERVRSLRGHRYGVAQQNLAKLKNLLDDLMIIEAQAQDYMRLFNDASNWQSPRPFRLRWEWRIKRELVIRQDGPTLWRRGIDGGWIAQRRNSRAISQAAGPGDMGNAAWLARESDRLKSRRRAISRIVRPTFHLIARLPGWSTPDFHETENSSIEREWSRRTATLRSAWNAVDATLAEISQIEAQIDGLLVKFNSITKKRSGTFTASWEIRKTQKEYVTGPAGPSFFTVTISFNRRLKWRIGSTKGGPRRNTITRDLIRANFLHRHELEIHKTAREIERLRTRYTTLTRQLYELHRLLKHVEFSPPAGRGNDGWDLSALDGPDDDDDFGELAGDDDEL